MEKPTLDEYWAEAAKTADLSGLGKKKVAWYFRSVHADLRSRSGYRYPWPGNWAEAPGPIQKHSDSCPQAEGDGLCVAKTFYGAGLGGIPATTLLLVGVAKRDILGEDDHKIRVRRMYVADVLALVAVLRDADLRGAYLRGANLGDAYLGGANLGDAYLGDANLGGAYLGDAYLRGAYLGGANLRDADLGDAYLGGANLGGANLGDANLGDAYLGDAYLGDAYLGGANLGGAYLGGANYSKLTLWPDGFDPVAAGAVLL